MRKNSLYIKDIIDAIEKIEEFIEGMSYEDFLEDDKTSSAVIKKLEIIGEAVKQVSKEVREKFESIPWSAMAKTRDKIVHFYHRVDYEIVWRIIKEELPILKYKLNDVYEILVKEEQKIK